MNHVALMRASLSVGIMMSLAGCGPSGELQSGSAGALHDDLAALFQEWRDFQEPEFVDGVPDYSAAAMAAQYRELAGYESRLAAIDTSGWSISEQVDYHVVRAEMNGLEFDHRVMRPWARNPSFYTLIHPAQSDVPAHEGPYVAGESEEQRQILDVPLDFGHRLSLLGYTFDRTQVAAGESWRIKTTWRVSMTPSPGGIDPLAIFVHVLDENNTVTAGWDGLYVPPEGWREGDVFIHIHTLTLPPGIPAGPQRTELGVYSPVTLERLAPFTGVGDETAPHHRVLLRPLNVLSNAQ